MNPEILFRLITFLMLAAALSISGYFRRKADREGGQMRSSEGRGLLVALRLLGLLVLWPVVGYLINPDWVAWARFTLPEWSRWLAVSVAVGCVPLIYWVFSSIGNNISPVQATRITHKLVTHGPYRWVRHPLYAVGFVFAVCLTLITTLWWLGVGMVLPLSILFLRTSKEEARLIETFGDDYRDYMKRTGRFFPKLTP